LADVICNTSPLQYLHQLQLLPILPALTTHVIVPPAVVEELDAGRALGVNLPDPRGYTWIDIREPAAATALPLVKDLGPGETQVLMLGLELRDAVVVIDDALGRRMAEALALRLTGTLGLLLDAKRAGLIVAVSPFLDRLEALRFRVSAETRAAVAKLAGEEQP
jgi:predicted nucleic acid-binding protein